MNVENNVRYVTNIAKRWAQNGGVSEADADDLIGEALVALVEAATTYEPGRGMAFRTWAHGQVENHLSRYLAAKRAELVPIERDTGQLWFKMQAHYAQLQQRLLREPTHAEWAEEAGVSMDVLQRLRMVTGTTFESLDVDLDDDSEEAEETLYDMLESINPDPSSVLVTAELSGALHVALDGLLPDESAVLRCLYGMDDCGDELSQAETAEHLGMAQQRVSEIHSRALRKLKARLRGHV